MFEAKRDNNALKDMLRNSSIKLKEHLQFHDNRHK